MRAEDFAQLLVTNIFRLHGVPMFLVSDREHLLPHPAVLDDGAVECEIEKVLARRDTKTGCRSYYVL
ncbi:hypothetical protein ABBQ38_012942 [Trebouxia sp. C0009 RCD-2024]